jgi:ribosomal protein L32
MGKPKTRTTSRKTGMRRSHLFRKLANSVNSHSPVKVQIGKTAKPKADK